ncbi:MAG: hypothetical protein M1834_000889 [Cirrosporium novae-zelandiae]|nr:MAG: hypothetical protein M1834_000889 [Cirrosporium novae-zelandiae]
MDRPPTTSSPSKENVINTFIRRTLGPVSATKVKSSTGYCIDSEEMETAIRWSPHSTASDQRFLLVDVPRRELKLCRPTSPLKTNQQVHFDTLATHGKVPIFRTFDWHPTNDRLVAVGISSGEATVLRLGEEGSQDALSFPVRSQRFCNSVAFSTTNLLAAGLDRVRNDFCLNVWDLNQCLPEQGFGTKKHREDPIRRLASSEPITSVKFFAAQPDLLVAGVKGQFVRVYDLREPPGSPSVQFPTRCVHNLTIDPLDEHYFASCAPIKDTCVCIWDIRTGPRLTYKAISQNTVMEFDPFSPLLEFNNVIDTAVPKHHPNIWKLSFSRAKRGCLGVLSSTGEFKVYEMTKDFIDDEIRQKRQEIAGEQADQGIPEMISTKRVQEVRYPFYHQHYGCEEEKRVVSFDFMNVEGQYCGHRAITLLGDNEIKTCDILPTPTSIDWSSRGELFVGKGNTELEEAVAIDYPSEGVTIHKNRLFTVIKPNIPDEPISQTLNAIRARRLAEANIVKEDAALEQSSVEEEETKAIDPRSSREMHEELFSFGPPGSKGRLGDALILDDIIRRRCEAGYLFDCKKNEQIVEDDIWLKEMWKWIGRAETQAVDEGMVHKGLDLSFAGVNLIWSENLGPDLSLRQTSNFHHATTSVSDAILGLVEDIDLIPFNGISTSYPVNRQLALYTCGAPLDPSSLDSEIGKAISKNQHTKAACIALVHDETKRAYRILKAGKTQSHKTLALGVAVVATHSTLSNTDAFDDWTSTCRDIARELSDPYARAIMALVSSNSWAHVLRETSLPLLDRIIVAVRNLPDKQLTSWLEITTSDAISHGDISALPLTGLTSQALALFHNYHVQTSDLQTPVLALSFACPRYISTTCAKTDPKTQEPFPFFLARQTYRQYLQTISLPLPRVRFDVLSSRLARSAHHNTSIPPPPRQVSLACAYCSSDLSKEDNGFDDDVGDVGESIEKGRQRTEGHPLAPKAGRRGKSGTRMLSGETSCPKCGRRMPRCGVCAMELGGEGIPMDSSSMSTAINNTNSSDAVNPSKDGTNNAGTNDQDPEQEQQTEVGDIMKSFVTVCVRCRHGFHFAHAREWFKGHSVCPVPECGCVCDQ